MEYGTDSQERAGDERGRGEGERERWWETGRVGGGGRERGGGERGRKRRERGGRGLEGGERESSSTLAIKKKRDREKSEGKVSKLAAYIHSCSA